MATQTEKPGSGFQRILDLLEDPKSGFGVIPEQGWLEEGEYLPDAWFGEDLRAALIARCKAAMREEREWEAIDELAARFTRGFTSEELVLAEGLEGARDATHLARKAMGWRQHSVLPKWVGPDGEIGEPPEFPSHRVLVAAMRQAGSPRFRPQGRAPYGVQVAPVPR